MPIDPFQRPRYAAGQLLAAADFQADQDYHVGKRRLLNRCLHGGGVVAGLQVAIDPSGTALTVAPGFALDCLGREIVVPEAASCPLAGATPGAFLLLRYDERPTALQPGPTGEEPDGDGLSPSRILESYALDWVAADPLAGHARRRARWTCCGRDHGLPLARLVARRQRLALDPRFAGLQDVTRRAAFAAA